MPSTGHGFDNLSHSDVRTATPPEATSVPLVSQTDCNNCFGSPRSAGAEAVNARESALAHGGAIDFNTHGDIYSAKPGAAGADAYGSGGADVSGGPSYGEATSPGAGGGASHGEATSFGATPGGGASYAEATSFRTGAVSGHGGGAGGGAEAVAYDAGAPSSYGSSSGGGSEAVYSGAAAPSSHGGGAGGGAETASYGASAPPASHGGADYLGGMTRANMSGVGGAEVMPPVYGGADGQFGGTDGSDNVPEGKLLAPAGNPAGDSYFVQNKEQVVSAVRPIFESPEWKAIDTQKIEAFKALSARGEALFGPQDNPRTYAEIFSPGEVKRLEESADKAKLDLLETGINKYLADSGRPPVKLSLTDDKDVNGLYRAGKGEVSLTSETLASPPDAAMNTIFHEVDHEEQDFLKISRVADQLGIGQTATAEQMRDLSKAFPNEKLNPNFVDDCIRARSGKQLSAADSGRADILLRADQAERDQYVAFSANRIIGNCFPKVIADMKEEPADESIKTINSLIKAGQEHDIPKFIVEQPEVQNAIGNWPRGENGQLIPGSQSENEAFKNGLIKAFEHLTLRQEAEAPMHTDNYLHWTCELGSRNTGDAIQKAYQESVKRAQLHTAAPEQEPFKKTESASADEVAF